MPNHKLSVRPPDLYMGPLQGLRTWNVDDGSFIGVVITSRERAVDDILSAIIALKLADIQLVHRTHLKIVFKSGAEIRVRVVQTECDADRHAGMQYWAVCYLDRIPDRAYQRIGTCIRWPSTHRPRRAGITSRIEVAVNLQESRVARKIREKKSQRKSSGAYWDLL